jgi:hypothetical protein
MPPKFDARQLIRGTLMMHIRRFFDLRQSSVTSGFKSLSMFIFGRQILRNPNRIAKIRFEINHAR